MNEGVCSGCGARLDRTVMFHPGTDVWRCSQCGEICCEFCKSEDGRGCPRCHGQKLVKAEL